MPFPLFDKPSSHTAFQSLPQVDISGLRAPEFAVRKQAAAQLGKVAREVGFFYALGHGVPPQQIERLKQRAREYFAQPLAAKMRNYIGFSSNHSGYVPEGEEQFYSGTIDHKEAYDIGFDLQTEDPSLRRPMLGPNQWPELPGFKEDVQAYYDSVMALAKVLFRGFALALELPEDTFTSKITTPPNQLRLVHYFYNAQIPQDRPGIGAHTDYECFTVLLPTAPGLEVLNGNGEWIDVPVVEGAFVINIGDMMELLSNGTFVATSHRVRKVAEERYSFPLFCTLDYDTVVAPLPALVSQEQPARYQPLTCGDHVHAQTVQTFQYLKQRLARGELTMPDNALALSSFGHKEKTGSQA